MKTCLQLIGLPFILIVMTIVGSTVPQPYTGWAVVVATVLAFGLLWLLGLGGDDDGDFRGRGDAGNSL
jgi:hypothetical protein